MIDDLYSQLNKHPNIGIACLYADYKDQSNQTLDHVLGSFLRQLLTIGQDPPDHVVEKLNKIRHQGKKVNTEDILALLKGQLDPLKRMFICIDAVDELEPKVRQQLLNVLKELATIRTNIRLFLTGRGYVENEVQIHFNIAQRFKVIINASQQDIQEFVLQEIKADHYLNSEAMDEGLEKDIVDTITRKSDGMWVMKS